MRRPAILALLLAAAAVLGAQKVGAQVDLSKPQIERFDDWQVRCFSVKSTSPCDMLFGTVRKATGRRIVSVSIAYAPASEKYFMQIAVPLGIALPQGVVVSAGTFKSATLVVRRCDQNGCYVESLADNGFIQFLQANSESNGSLKVVADGGKPVSLGLSLKGFAKAHEAMVRAARREVSGRGDAPRK